MCKENRQYLFILLVGLLLSCVVGVLRAEEPDRWFLTSETEILSIEQYKVKSETEKQNLLLQVRKSQETAASLQRNSETLSNQLSEARKAQMRSELLYNKSEAEKLILLSSKNGEIADLKEEKAAEVLQKERYKGLFRLVLAIAVFLALSWIVAIGIKVCRFLKIFPV